MKTWFSLLILSVACGTVVGQQPANDLTQTATPLHVRILANGTIDLRGQSLGLAADLSTLKSALEHIFAERKKHGVYDPEQRPNVGVNLPLARKLVVHADESVEFPEVLRVLRLVRDLGARPLDLQVGDGENKLTMTIPVPADVDEDTIRLRPNPLMLRVTIDGSHRIALNGEQQVSQEALLERLRRIFRQREELKVYGPGSDQIEASLFLKADPSLPFPSLIDLLRQLRQTGANPMGLQIDDLSSFR